jgi:hypothetical protein
VGRSTWAISPFLFSFGLVSFDLTLGLSINTRSTQPVKPAYLTIPFPHLSLSVSQHKLILAHTGCSTSSHCLFGHWTIFPFFFDILVSLNHTTTLPTRITARKYRLYSCTRSLDCGRIIIFVLAQAYTSVRTSYILPSLLASAARQLAPPLTFLFCRRFGPPPQSRLQY